MGLKELLPLSKGAGSTWVAHGSYSRPSVRRKLNHSQDRWKGHQCHVTNSEEEMKDPRNPVTNDPYVVPLPPDYQIPQPELGPLEQRVDKTYIEAMYNDEVSIEDTNYWFTEPKGGWNSEVRYGERLKEVQPKMNSAIHFGPGRKELKDMRVGEVLEGEVECLMYYHGVQVDLGCQFDGLIPIRQEDWVNDHFRSKFGVSSGVSEDFEIGQIVKVQIYAINHRPKCRFPIQLIVLEPDVQHKILHPDLFNFSFDLRGVSGWDQACGVTGRPMPDVPLQDNYLPTDAVGAMERQIRSQELSELSYGQRRVNLHDMYSYPPIADRIQNEAEQRHAGCIEPWKEGYEEDEITDDIIEEIVS